jgi:hypothetical protein
MHIHVQPIKQNMHTIFLKSTVIFKNLSMKFKTKFREEGNGVHVIPGIIRTCFYVILKTSQNNYSSTILIQQHSRGVIFLMVPF